MMRRANCCILRGLCMFPRAVGVPLVFFVARAPLSAPPVIAPQLREAARTSAGRAAAGMLANRLVPADGGLGVLLSEKETAERRVAVEGAIVAEVRARMYGMHAGIKAVDRAGWSPVDKKRWDAASKLTPPQATRALPDAKEDLRDAERRLDRAKRDRARDLQDAERRNVADYVAKRPMEIVPPTAMQARRVGRRGFDEELRSIIVELMRVPPSGPQHSVGTVLTTASGVGKTFASVTFRTGRKNAAWRRQQVEAMSVYLGFNMDWPLRADETAMLQALRGKGEKIVEGAIQAVVLQRLLLSLAATLKYLEGGTLRRLDQAGKDAQLVTRPSRDPGDATFLKLDEGPLLQAVLQQLTRLLKHRSAAKRTLVVLVVVDEAQILDQYVTNGARLALRVLRRLQVDAFKKDNGLLVLPMATGICVRAVQSPSTVGRNDIIGRTEDSSLMSLKDFIKLAVGKRSPPMTKQESTMIAVCTYPVVRSMLRLVTNPESAGSAPLKITTVFEVPLASHDALDLIFSAFTGSRVRISRVPAEVPVTCVDPTSGDGVPLLPFGVWSELCSSARNLIPTLFFPPMPTHAQLTMQPDFGQFEHLAFAVWGLFMAIFNDPVTCQWSPQIAEPCIAKWIPFGFRLSQKSTLPNPTHHYYPFDGHGNHATAASGCLHSLVVQCIQKLKVDQGCWIHCRGSAAVDYVLVVRRAGGYQLRFMDAKHCTSLSCATGMKSNGMRRKAKEVYEGMTRELRSRFKCTQVEAYDDSHLLIFTNHPSPGDGCIGPSNFTWQPWTTLLYAKQLMS